MDTLTLKVPEGLHARLDSYARKKGLSKSEIIRLALDEYLQDESRFKGSFLEMSRDLAGSIDAPPDLSSNKDHIKGYGE